MLIVEWILTGIGLYVLFGLILGLGFVFRGVDRIDPAARSTSLGFRLVILPGTVALWPLMVARWLQAIRTGDAS